MSLKHIYLFIYGFYAFIRSDRFIDRKRGKREEDVLQRATSWTQTLEPPPGLKPLFLYIDNLTGDKTLFKAKGL